MKCTKCNYDFQTSEFYSELPNGDTLCTDCMLDIALESTGGHYKSYWKGLYDTDGKIK